MGKLFPLFKLTFSRMIVGIWNIADFILPYGILSLKIRAPIFNLFWKTGKGFDLNKRNKILFLGKLKFGNKCGINLENIFDNNSKICFGDNCMIGYRNLFITTSHVEKNKQKKNELIYSKPILVGNNVWITSNCTILPGTVIEDNVILSAGSVARGKLESGWIYSGNPAVKIRKTEGTMGF
jgi:acetyltransferase-like isoleucine patch superfamily enzyme